jgi:hypothetical protein
VRRLLLLLLALACAHTPPRATVLGKRVGLGELVADAETKAVLKDALAERFELDPEKAELHLHLEASMSGADEPVMRTPSSGAQSPMMPMVYRRVQSLRVTIRLVEDATGEVRALGIYELQERGPERPMGSHSSDELGVILARRAVRAFIEENRL